MGDRRPLTQSLRCVRPTRRRETPMASTFWSWRRNAASSATYGSAALQLMEEHEPVEIYTRGAMITGTVVSHGERLSDILNHQDSVRIHAPRALPYGDVDEVRQSEDGTWETIAAHEILFVMPPSHVSHP